MLSVTPSISPEGQSATSARASSAPITTSTARRSPGYGVEKERSIWDSPARWIRRAISRSATTATRIPASSSLPARRRTGGPVYDFTFSAPKSVSVIYELSGDERILDAFRKALKETMDEVEGEMKTRVRKAAGTRTGDRQHGLGGIRPFHGEARGWKPDPHLHAHVYAFNLRR